MPGEGRIVVAPLSEGLTRVELRFGFMDEPNVLEALAVAIARGQIEKFDLTGVIYYTGLETIIRPAAAPACLGGARRLPSKLNHFLSGEVPSPHLPMFRALHLMVHSVFRSRNLPRTRP